MRPFSARILSFLFMAAEKWMLLLSLSIGIIIASYSTIPFPYVIGIYAMAVSITFLCLLLLSIIFQPVLDWYNAKIRAYQESERQRQDFEDFVATRGEWQPEHHNAKWN